jgi:hypothetical protein
MFIVAILLGSLVLVMLLNWSREKDGDDEE